MLHLNIATEGVRAGNKILAVLGIRGEEAQRGRVVVYNEVSISKWNSPSSIIEKLVILKDSNINNDRSITVSSLKNEDSAERKAIANNVSTRLPPPINIGKRGINEVSVSRSNNSVRITKK